MSLRMLDLTVDHIASINPQWWQRDWLQVLEEDPFLLKKMTFGGLNKAIVDGDDILMIGGAIHATTRSSTAWAVVSTYFKDPKYTLGVTRKVIEFLDMIHYKEDMKRIQTTVKLGFREGHRWAKLLGFRVEGIMECAEIDGTDSVLYARIR